VSFLPHAAADKVRMFANEFQVQHGYRCFPATGAASANLRGNALIWFLRIMSP
jgi:hypothetical protein